MPKANIRLVMEMLDPERCALEYEIPNYMARETFSLRDLRVRNGPELLEVCKRYYVHHYRTVNHDVTPEPDAVDGEIYRILERFPGGRDAALALAKGGFGGGVGEVLNAIRDRFIKEHEDNWFNHSIMEAVDIMDLEDIETLMEQYVRRYGRHMDPRPPSAKYLVLKYREVIKAHAQIVRKIRTYFSG